MLQASDHNLVPKNAEALARAYIDELARREGVAMRSMVRKASEDDELSDFLDGLEGKENQDTPTLRADLAATAVCLARAFALEKGLAGRLRHGQPAVVTIRCFSPDQVDLVEDVAKRCAVASSALIVAKDGTEKTGQNAGGADVVRAIGRRMPVVGIAQDPKRQLPTALLRMTEYDITMPAVDEWCVRLVIEAVTGCIHEGPIDAHLIRSADFTDLSLAFRRDLSPAACIERLTEIVRRKPDFTGEGPALEDLDGYGEAKIWGLELAADLSDYKSGTISWEQVDHKALLLSGPPGTGKTSYAKAVAKSAQVPLVSTSVADWNAATYLSGTLQAIRRAFADASRQAPSILFIDEIDGISSRTTLRGDYVEYWTQIVNALLECLSGVEERPGVVVIAATNYPENIDAAILRAGRLDHHIKLDKPDAVTLAKIVRHHVGPGLLASADFMPIGVAGRGGTGADAEAWVRRAKAIARRGRRTLELQDILDQVRAGRAPLTPEARRRIAIHEAGHVVVASTLDAGKIVSVSIAENGGITELDATFDGLSTPEQVVDQVVVAMAGRVAEELLLGNFAIGAGYGTESDLAKASRLAEMLETQYGSGTLGSVFLGDNLVSSLSRFPGLLEAVRARVDGAKSKATDILSARLPALRHLADELGKKGYLAGDEVRLVLERVSDVPRKDRAK